MPRQLIDDDLEFDEHDLSDAVGDLLIKNKKQMKANFWHNLRTIAMWAIIFIIGGLQALKGFGIGDFTAAVALLGIVEHALEGRS